jgi:tetratricopeptide (TPR) repeat protein
MFIFVNLVVWYFWIFVLLLTHECGHAAAARLMRMRVLAMIIGYGRNLLKFEAFGVPIEINARPLNGLTIALPDGRGFTRLRFWIFNLGGIGTHVVFVAIGVLLAPPTDIWSFLGALTNRLAWFETFILANAFLFFANAIPYKLNMPQGTYFSDGYRFFQIPFARVEDLMPFEKLTERLEAWNLLRTGDVIKAKEKYLQLISENPDDMLAKHDLAVAELSLGNFASARAVFREALESKEFESPAMNLLVKNNIAWVSAILGEPEMLAEADRFAGEAYASNPKLVNFIGTTGAVLARLGQYQAGLRLLEDAFGKTSETAARAANACFVAYAYAGIGDFKQSDHWMDKARTIDPDNACLGILSKEVEAFRAKQD